MTWFLLLDLDDCDSTWPQDFRGARLFLERRETIASDELPEIYRISPVFPFVEDATPPPLSTSRNVFFHFICPRNPFREIGRLTAQLNSARQSCLWFSHGAAALISISTDKKLGHDLLERLSEKPLAYETWRVSANTLHTVVVDQTPSLYDSDPWMARPTYAGLPPDLRAVVDEFVSSLDTLRSPLLRNQLVSIEPYRLLATETHELIEDLDFLVGRTPPDTPPPGLQSYSEDELRNPDLRTKLIHHRTDSIVQINSALSYVSSQLHSGTPPILERRCLIRRYSLLGIGSAVRALNRLINHVTTALATGRVESTISSVFSKPTSKALPGFPHEDGHDPQDWGSFSVASRADEAEHIVPPPKIAYYSGRLGFREAQYAVSSAVHVLWAGDTVDWSIGTMTHEILHGHVRNLLSQVFHAQPDQASAIDTGIYPTFEKMMDGEPKEKFSTLDSIRSLILSYCCLVPTWGSIAAAPDDELGDPRVNDAGDLEGTVKIYDEATTWRLLEQEYRNISEILVHVLDFHYFYRSQPSIYLPFIWQSWAAIPSVSHDLRQYILRSLLALATAELGPPHFRYDQSVKAFLRSLEPFASPSTSYSLIPQVLRILTDPAILRDYRPAFLASLRIADLGRHLFFSPTVRASLLAQDTLVSQSGIELDGIPRLRYSLNDLEFLDKPILSPTAFLFSRLDRSLQRTLPQPDPDRAAAWLLLALTAE